MQSTKLELTYLKRLMTSILVVQYDILTSSYQHQKPQCLHHKMKHILTDCCRNMLHMIWEQTEHLGESTAAKIKYEHISVSILSPPAALSEYRKKPHTCRMRSILEPSYIANWVSWTTNKRIWSEWNWTRVSPTGDFPAGSWIGTDFLFSQVSMLHTHICTTCRILKTKKTKTLSTWKQHFLLGEQCNW